VWDSAAHGIGKMAYAISPDNIRTDFRYDAFGRAVGTDYTDTDRAVYSVDLHYDTAGRLLTRQYPQAGPAGTGRLTL
jgi:YD repeat-containing protein